MAVARYRERTSLSGSPAVRAITVLARGYQDAVWRRTEVLQELRARLVESYPGFLAAFGAGSKAGSERSTTQLASRDARAVLAIAPSPAEGLRMSQVRVEAALRRVGRQRRIAARSGQIVAALRVPQLRQDPVVEAGMRAETLVLLGILDAACGAVDELAALLAEAFRAHPDHTIITSFPGLADITLPRFAAETTAPGARRVAAVDEHLDVTMFSCNVAGAPCPIARVLDKHPARLGPPRGDLLPW
jgi:hypothetical protein